VEVYTAADAEVMELPDEEDEGDKSDPFNKLERGERDKRFAIEARERLSELREDSQAKYKLDYEMNRQLRRTMRWKLGRVGCHCP
jgi:Saf4/Yju2 protein